MAYSGLATPLISVLLPTRGRPQLVRRFLESLLATAEDPDGVEIVLYLDEDDASADLIGELAANVRRVVGPRVTMGAANSACLRHASGDILLLANDDIVVTTQGWDTRFRACHARFADGVYLAWPNDGFASYRISTFPILARRTCELLGDPYPAVYQKAFIDTELLDIFMRLKRLGPVRMVYLGTVVFEHHHHRTGKRDVDATSRVHLRFVDDATFLARVAARQLQAERLAAVCANAAVPGEPLPVPAASMSLNPATALSSIARSILLDAGLPLSRRVYLFIWYCGRYAAARLLRTTTG